MTATDTPCYGPTKYLVIAADTPEARLAAYFAGRRASRVDARVKVLCVLEPPEFGHWASVAETMRAEAREAGEALLREFAAETGVQPETEIREGDLNEELRREIDADADIAFLFLGAGAGASGPGALVSALAKDPRAIGGRPLPIVIVPGDATRDDLDRLAGLQ